MLEKSDKLQWCQKHFLFGKVLSEHIIKTRQNPGRYWTIYYNPTQCWPIINARHAANTAIYLQQIQTIVRVSVQQDANDDEYKDVQHRTKKRYIDECNICEMFGNKEGCGNENE